MKGRGRRDERGGKVDKERTCPVRGPPQVLPHLIRVVQSGDDGFEFCEPVRLDVVDIVVQDGEKGSGDKWDVGVELRHTE